MTAGLVSNVVLESLAEIRRNTHRILSQFSSDLDAPYLTHRVLLFKPDEAEDLLSALVAEELQGILEDARVGSRANLEAVEAWVQAKQEAGVHFTLELGTGNDEPLTIEKVIDLLRMGIQNQDWNLTGLSNTKRNNAHKLPLVRMFQPDHPNPGSLDEKFAFITTMRACYEHYVPRLTLGTILKTGSDPIYSYWVCIQPRCDCVRMDSVRAFPFLPLKQAGEAGKFNIVLNEGDAYIRLLFSEKPYDIRLIRFRPRKRDKGVVTAKRDGDTFYFQSTGNCKYTWIGELRQEQVQRLSNQFAAAVSRVGLDESEWLRLWATRE